MIALIFDVLPDVLNRSTAAGCRKVTSAPKYIFPITINNSVPNIKSAPGLGVLEQAVSLLERRRGESKRRSGESRPAKHPNRDAFEPSVKRPAQRTSSTRKTAGGVKFRWVSRSRYRINKIMQYLIRNLRFIRKADPSAQTDHSIPSHCPRQQQATFPLRPALQPVVHRPSSGKPETTTH